MSDITTLSLISCLDELKSGKFTCLELVEAFLSKIELYSDLNIFITVCKEEAIAMAKESDKRYASKTARPLEGAIIAIKDMFCTEGIKTTAASKILEDFIPPYNSTVVENLLNQGAIIIGKTNLDEFAMGSSNITSYFGPVINPINSKEKLVAGGSSGGSAAAVSQKLCHAALGTDTGGSIRQPSSFTNTVGVKPSYGRCSRYGIIAFASSLDQAGVFANNVLDAGYMLENMMGYDDKDSTSVDIGVPKLSSLVVAKQASKSCTNAIKTAAKKSIGIPVSYKISSLPTAIVTYWQEAYQAMEDLGYEIKYLDESIIMKDQMDYALAAYYVIAPAEASSNLARYDGIRYGFRADSDNLADLYKKTRSQGFGLEVKRRIMVGTYVLSHGYYDAYYLQAQKVRQLISDQFTQAFKQVDAILTPTCPNLPFRINRANHLSQIEMYHNDIFTVPASLVGLPAISVPFAKNSDGLPIGIQIIGPSYYESQLFEIATDLENISKL